MSIDQYVFNGPKWNWRRIDYQIDYGPVDNLVTISSGQSKDKHVHVSVPAEFVKFLHDTVKVKGTVSLWLEHRENRWAFGFTTGSDDYDLWYYTASSFPLWAGK